MCKGLCKFSYQHAVYEPIWFFLGCHYDSEVREAVTLAPSRRKIGISLGRTCHFSFAHYALQNEVTKKQLVLKCQRMLRDEMKVLFSKPTLVLNDLDMHALSKYTFDELCSLLPTKAPLINGISLCLHSQA